MTKYLHWLFFLTTILSSTLSLSVEEVLKPTTQQLLNPDWIEKRFKQVGIDPLIALYNGHQQKDALLVKSALNLSRDVIRRYPDKLRSQLQARLVSHHQPSLLKFQILPKGHTQIVALTPILAQAGGPLIRYYSNNKNGVIFASFVADGKQIVTMTKQGTIQFYESKSGNKIRSIETKLTPIQVKITRDKKLLIFYNSKGTLIVWDLKQGKMRRKIAGLPNFLRAHLSHLNIELSQDGTKATTQTNKKELICWDIKSGKKLHSLQPPLGNISCTAISPDATQIIIAVRYTYYVFDMATGRKLTNILPQKKRSAPLSIAITTDNQHAIIEKRNSFELLNLNTGENRIYTNTNIPAYAFNQMIFSVNEGKIVANLAGKTQYIWNAQTGKLLKSNLNVPLRIKPTSISFDGSLALGAGPNEQIALYDLQKMKETNPLVRKPFPINSLATSINEKIIITGGNGNLVNVWDFKTLKLIKSMKGHTEPVNAVAITPDGKRAVSRSLDGFTRLWDLKTGKILKKIQHGVVIRDGKLATPPASSQSVLNRAGTTTYLLISPDGKEVISQFFFRPQSKIVRKNTVVIPLYALGTWSLHNGKMRSCENLNLAPNVNQAVLTPDGKQILTTGRDNQVTLWDYQSSLKQTSNIKHVFNYQRTTSKIHHLAVSTDGKQIVSSAEDGVISLWNIKTEKTDANITQFFHWHEGFITLLKFLPGNQLVISASISITERKPHNPISILRAQGLLPRSRYREDNSIRIWNYKTNKLITTFHLDTSFRSITLSPSGKYIMIGTQYGKLHKLRIDD